MQEYRIWEALHLFMKKIFAVTTCDICKKIANIKIKLHYCIEKANSTLYNVIVQWH